jgi:hypothetical protein
LKAVHHILGSSVQTKHGQLGINLDGMAPASREVLDAALSTAV